ncbi:serine protease easter-like isoform X2 [Eurosta solidaginis]
MESNLKNKSLTTTTQAPALPTINVVAIGPPQKTPIPSQSELLTTTEPPIENYFENSLNPRGLNILRSQKCGFVYASKNPNGTNIEADILEFPWLALLQYEGTNGQKDLGCGGSLITERWVLTAAQCIKPNLVGVRLGEYDIKDNTKKDCSQEKGMKTCTQYKEFVISKAIRHPDFDQKSGRRDVGLIKLKARAQRNKNIKPICLPTQGDHFDAPYDEESLRIAGWKSGAVDASTIIKKHTVRQRPILICSIAYLFKHTDESKMCLDSGNDQFSTCSGDPGSPVFWLYKNTTEFYIQIGIVPFGMDECGYEQSVPYYVESVANSMYWITAVIGEDQ